jgi:hypothetical protein
LGNGGLFEDNLESQEFSRPTIRIVFHDKNTTAAALDFLHPLGHVGGHDATVDDSAAAIASDTMPKLEMIGMRRIDDMLFEILGSGAVGEFRLGSHRAFLRDLPGLPAGFDGDWGDGFSISRRQARAMKRKKSDLVFCRIGHLWELGVESFRKVRI